MRLAGALAALALSAALADAEPPETEYVYGSGPFRAEYEPPAPGSYSLPVIRTLSDHPVVDSESGATTLLALKRGRLAVVAFVYTSCAEATGCPFSLAAVQRLDRDLAAIPALRGRVTLVAASFDPERDTPDRMATIRRLRRPETDWRFVTARNEDELRPLLDDFGQSVVKLRFADGRWTGRYRHVLKVFLIDAEDRIRNVYSVGFLNPALVLADLQTLAIEEARRAPERSTRGEVAPETDTLLLSRETGTLLYFGR